MQKINKHEKKKMSNLYLMNENGMKSAVNFPIEICYN